MITAIVGSGGKTSLLKELAAKYLAEGKRVFVTTSTHMFTEEGTLCTDDPACIIPVLNETGFAMADSISAWSAAAAKDRRAFSSSAHLRDTSSHFCRQDEIGCPWVSS